MNLDREPSTIATAAAEEIRALNHATLDAKAWQYPSEIHDTVRPLHDLAQRLPQALQQAAAGLRHLEDAGLLQVRGGGGTEPVVSEVLRQLLNAQGAAGALRDTLAAASSALSELGGVYRPEDDDELADGEPARA